MPADLPAETAETAALVENGENGATPPSARGLPRLLKVAVAVVGLAVLVLIVGGIWLWRQVNPPGSVGPKVTVEIPRGSSVARVASILDAKDVVTSARIFRVYVRVTGAGDFQAGVYARGELRREMDMRDAVEALEEGPVIEYQRLTVPEGQTLRQIAERVGKLPGRSGDRFLELANSGAVQSKYQPAGGSLEGLLFPDTYNVAETEDEKAILSRMVTLFDRVADSARVRAGAKRLGITPYEAIVIASLIEEETKVADERRLVSAVIHNRLEKGMLLQIDATVLYALGAHKDRVLFSDLEIDSPYNTYKYPGLPPTPIAAMGGASLEAAVDPADEDYLYYVKTDTDGSHAFATTGEEHQRNVADARARGVR
jgi:UPF0755 protein